MYENEVRFYREIRPQLEFETPQIYASTFDNETGQFGVIMEDLNVRNVQFPNATTDVSVEQVAGLLRTLATLHAAYWQSPKLDNELSWISTPTKGGMSDVFATIGLDLIKDQVEKNQFKQDLIAPIGLNLDQMWDKLTSFQHEMEQQPQTLLHGDTHIANTYLLPEKGDGSDGGLFDWQLMVRGHWAHDVSYVICTGLSIDDRRAHLDHLLKGYLADLADKGVSNAPDFDLAYSQVSRSIMWGLVVGWLITPPANYGEEITTANISKLVAAVMDLESFQ